MSSSESELTSALWRLLKTKLVVAAMIGMVAGVVLLAIGLRVESWPDDSWTWLKDLPLEAVGGSLFSTALIVLVIEFLGREDLEQRSLERTRQVLAEQEPLIRRSILDGFAFDPAFVRQSSDEVLDTAIRRCLGARLDDQQLGDELYTDLREQIFRATERWHDLRINATLMPYLEGGERPMFVATLRWEYRLVLRRAQFRFRCVGNEDAYRSILADSETAFAWYFEPIGSYQEITADVFDVLAFSVDGVNLPLVATQADGSREIVATSDGLVSRLGQEVTVAYTCRVLVQRNSHLMQIDVAQPSRGCSCQLTYTGCGIRHVNVLDFVAGSKQPWISRSTVGAPVKAVDVRYDGWVLPKSGFAFVWVLDEEFQRSQARNTDERTSEEPSELPAHAGLSDNEELELP